MREYTKEVVANLLCYLIDNHENEPLSESTLQQIGVKFLADEQYRVVVNHTDPGEIKAALVLADRQLKRTEGKLIACEKALKVYRDRDKQLEDVLMPDKGGDK